MRAFIFDMDGTLLDSIYLWFQAEDHIVSLAGATLTKEQRDYVNKLTLEEAGEFFHSEFGILGDGEEVTRAIIDYIYRFYQTTVELKPGAGEFVRAAHAAGAPMCVLSSSPKSFIEAGLERTGLAQYFPNDLLISAEENHMTKRERSTFEHVCGLLGCDLADTWLFDDSWYALEAARSAGMHCAGIFSDDKCGTHDELARYSEVVADDFANLDVADFLV